MIASVGLTEQSAAKARTLSGGQKRRLDVANDEVALLRAAQESLSDVRKHASASNVSIVLVCGPDATTLTVDDHGRGFDPDSIDGGFGLRGLHNRLEQVGGSAAVASATGNGTRVTVTVHP